MAKTPLQVAAAAQDDAKKTKKARGILAGLAALLGLGAEDVPAPDARSSKHTVTTKRTETMEDDEEGTEPPEDDSSSGGDDADAEAEEDSAAEHAEEDEDAEEAVAAPGAAAAAAPSVAKPRKGMFRAALAAADAAFIAAVPEQYRASAALRMPSRLVREAKHATGEKTLDGAFGALSALPTRAKALAKMEADVVALKADGRKRRIDEIVSAAKSEGRAGATSVAGRASLRALGMAQGSQFLRSHVATLPIVAPTRERIPRQDERGEVIGAPSAMDQKAMAEKARAGLGAEDAKAFDEILAEKLKMNGVAPRTTED